MKKVILTDSSMRIDSEKITLIIGQTHSEHTHIINLFLNSIVVK